jgi:hypothetical protein
MKKDKLQQLINQLQSGNDQQRRAASYKLGKSKDQSAVPALISAYNDKDSSVRQNVIDGLRLIRTKEATEFLEAKARCKAGNHNWAHEWAATGEHTFGNHVAEADFACLLIRTCSICGLIEKEEKHGEFHTIQSEQMCKYKQVCDICGAIVGFTTKHGSSHTADSSNPCMLNLVCDQCGEIVGEIENHDYGMPFDCRFPVFPDDYYYHKAVMCNRCSYIKQL